MEPIAILTAAAGILSNSAIGELTKRSVGEAWDAVKATLAKRHDSSSEAIVLLDKLRAAPATVPPEMIQQRLVVDLTKDPETLTALVNLAQKLATVNNTVTGAVYNYGTVNQTNNIS